MSVQRVASEVKVPERFLEFPFYFFRTRILESTLLAIVNSINDILSYIDDGKSVTWLNYNVAAAHAGENEAEQPFRQEENIANDVALLIQVLAVFHKFRFQV